MKGKSLKRFFVFLMVLFTALTMVSCGGGGGGGGGGTPSGGATTTTISGKVTLSSTVSGKPAYMFSNAAKTASKARMAKARGKAGASDVAGSQMRKVLSAVGLNKSVQAAALGGATVELYDADHPEWLYPIAYTTAGSDGSFTINTLINACTSTVTTDCNDATYTNGAEIPVGKYTLIAYKYDISYGKLFVAVQAVVKEYSGAVTGNDLTAQDSEATPSIVSMFGLSKNTDGSYGSTTTPLPANAAIQVTFSMAMARLTVLSAVSITDSNSTAVTGSWKLSSDLLSATFVPDAMTADTVYTVKVAGGRSSNAAKNVYGKAITSEVKGYFKTVSADSTPPTAIRVSPTSAEKSNMEITTPVRIASDEVLDINTISVASSPSIGAKPGILYIGKTGSGDYPFVYEIVPADPFTLGMTYTITVSGGKDLAGNSMDQLNFSLTTKSTSTGVTGTGATADAQAAVKDVLGKWVRAMNDRNTSVLTTYMTGDFYWLSSDMKGEDDANRDGRTDLNEFTTMLDKWLVQLEGCGATITGEIVDDPADATDGIIITGSTATIKFTLTATATNTSDASCKEVGGPESALYAELQNINGAWLMTRGSDTQITTWPASLSVISLVSPGNGNQLAEPTTAMPTTPEFKWTGVSGVATYAVVLVDAMSPWGETGWIALIDGTGTSGNDVSVKFNPNSGYTGSVYVLPSGDSFGFEKSITEIKPGGSYYWAVLGFGTKTVTDFVKGVSDPAADISASSDAYNFTVKGTYQELKVTVKDSTGKIYDFSEFMNGYNVGSASSLILTIERPFNSLETTAYVEVSGYTWKQYSAAFNSSGIASVTIDLSNKYNWVRVSDIMDPWNEPDALIKEFNIFTTGGILPKIKVTEVENKTSISGKKCDGSTAATFTGPTDWNDYTSSDACTVDFTVSVSSTLNVSLIYVNVWNDDDNGRYNTQVSVTPGTSVTLSDIPVYNGFNWISVSGWDSTTLTNYNYGFGVDTAAGSTYSAPITATLSSGTMTSSDYWGAYWDAGIASSVTISGIMQNKSSNGHYDHNIGEDWIWIAGGDIVVDSSTGAYSIASLSLYKGWNVINISDSTWSNWYSVHIYTTGGTAYTQPNTITAISKDGGSTWDTSPAYNYNAGSACSVAINGETTTAGTVYVYLSYYNSTTGNSVWEYQNVETDPLDITSPYSYQIAQNVYGGGTNSISINDANWRWAGVEVTTTCSTTPVAFGVTDVKAGSTSLSLDQYGFYNAGSAQTVTAYGTAKSGKTITAYISGSNYDTATATADGSNQFAIDLPIYNGDNYISLTDGENWYYLNVYTTGNRAYTPPIYNVSASSSTLTYGGGTADNWSQWNTSADSVTITGSGKTNGTGYYYQSGSYTYTSGNMCIVSGTIKASDCASPLTFNLDYGWNYIYLYDANWNYYSVTIDTSGGTGKPEQFVTIISPVNSYVVKGTDTANASETVSVNVTGTIVPGSTSFVPAYIYGYVYDYNTYQWTYYYWDGVTDANTIASWGYQPLTYSSGSFSFTASVKEGNQTQIEVYAYDSNSYSHGHYINVNNIWNYSEWFWKPGKKASGKEAIKNAHETEFRKKIMNRKQNRKVR